MIYKVNVFENVNNPRDLRFILTNPKTITRVMKGYRRKVRSEVFDVTEDYFENWRDQVTVEIRG